MPAKRTRPNSWIRVAGGACLALGLVDCGSSTEPGRAASFVRTEARAPCADHDPLRRPFFGDLHVHTGRSFDAYTRDARTGPADAYRFARGEPVRIAPLDPEGRPTRELVIDVPLDFAAVTDHSEFLGEVRACTDPTDPGYGELPCRAYRDTGNSLLQVILFGAPLIAPSPERFRELCGTDGARCRDLASDVWGEARAAAEGAYDRSAACRFTAFIGYEWTGNTGFSTFHRNVIFRNDRVPDTPISYFEAPRPSQLWDGLRANCLEGTPGCDVIAIPHNSNTSNGRAFLAEYPGATRSAEQAQAARARASMEPLMEVFQAKGSSECANLDGTRSAGFDPLCEFEQRPGLSGRPDCGEGGGAGGLLGTGQGCVTERDYLRGALLAGLAEEQRVGANPFRLGVIASTDTHTGLPGAVSEGGFIGESADDGDPRDRITPAGLETLGVVSNPGGLAGAWAEENSRDAIFEALTRRETFGTSGPRIVPRFFGGAELPADACERPDLAAVGYGEGVPMGGTLSDAPRSSPDTHPRFLVAAQAAPATAGRGLVPLERLQIVKGWVTESGEDRLEVIDLIPPPPEDEPAPTGCELPTGGSTTLCATWIDSDHDPALPTYWYARVVERPTCRWTTIQCNALPEEERPATCSDPGTPAFIRERAWTSPIWHSPPPEQLRQAFTHEGDA